MPIHMITSGGAWMPLALLGSGLLFIVYQAFALWDTFRTPEHRLGTLLRALLTVFGYIALPMLVGFVAGIVMAMHAGAQP